MGQSETPGITKFDPKQAIRRRGVFNESSLWHDYKAAEWNRLGHDTVMANMLLNGLGWVNGLGWGMAPSWQTSF